MAFKDIEKVMYNGEVRLTYLDGPHMYFVQRRKDWILPEIDKKAWGPKKRPKGTTTLLGDTLEKKGLLTWPMGLALRELFGFYDFKNDKGEQMTGFSKGVGTLWEDESGVKALNTYLPEGLLPLVVSASKAHLRKKKKGADIGSVVHDAIEHYILSNPNHLVQEINEDFEPLFDKEGNPKMYLPPLKGSGFDIAEQYMWSIKAAEYESEEEKDQALKDFQADVAQAELAFGQFKIWWDALRPVLYGAEDIVYSMELNYSGTFDGLIGIKREDHPVPDMMPNKSELLVMTDWKTSNASASKDAAAPQGVYYSYFIQSAAYALAWAEMGFNLPDDIAIASCRKDGNFDIIFASQLGLTVQDCIDWWKCVVTCYKFMDQTKRGLLASGEAKLNKGKE